MRKSMCAWVLQMPAATYGFRSASPRRALLQLHVWRAGTPAARPTVSAEVREAPCPRLLKRPPRGVCVAVSERLQD